MTTPAICVCGKPGRQETKSQRDRFRKTGRSYCSDECRDRWTAQQSSERMAATNRRYASARMTEHNPMADPDARARMAATLRSTGHQPGRRGGNGSGPTDAQKLLAEALGWEMEVVVKTGRPRRPGVPTNYKIDIADLATKTAVEVDGRSHRALARRSADERKDAFLLDAGWRIVRVSNESIHDDLAAVVREVLGR